MKTNSIFFIIAIGMLCSFNSADLKDLPEPYCRVNLYPFDGHGWYANAAAMEALIRENNIKTIIEVGCWLGASTRHMASLLPDDGKVYAVDHWLGSVEHQPGRPFWHPALDHLYDQFLSNVIHAGLTDKIVPYRLGSLDAAALLNIEVDLVYIDASHDYQSVLADIRAWYPHVKMGGIMSGDDFGGEENHGIERAVRQFTQENNLEFITNGWFWYIIKKG